MSLKIVQQETHACDFCGTGQSYMDLCSSCGKDICYDCSKVKAVKYPHSTWASGSGDGLYCIKCDADKASSPDRLWLAYAKIKSLRAEYKRFNDDFENRRMVAEKEVQHALGRKS